jgi:2-polyprenyl-3-methyl-5-hydroxy-6-metoxy-1,4-benzoquinol methylase
LHQTTQRLEQIPAWALVEMTRLEQVIRDFDAIAGALAAAAHADVLTPAERALLRHVPPNARRALDVGCGDGVVARTLARRGLTILALDISPRMIELARARTDRALPVEYHVGDIMTTDLPAGAFDVVTSINMLHHLPLSAVVPRLAALVAPGGSLLIQDVQSRTGVRYLPMNAAAAIRRRFRALVSPPRITREAAALYERHGAGELYLTPTETIRAYRALLPNALIERHLEWRYSAVWRRQGGGMPESA